MLKKMSLSVVLLMFLNASCLAGETLDTYFPRFESCLKALNTKFIVDKGTYRVHLNYKALLNTMEEMDRTSVLMVASIAIEWDQDTEFPEYQSLTTKEGKMQLAKAIQTAQARAILKAAEAILTKDLVWL